MQATDGSEDNFTGSGEIVRSGSDLSTAVAEACWRRCQALRPKLAVYLRGLLPDPHAVDDCLQETFLLMAQRYADAGDDDLAPLAFTCARKKAQSWLARNRVGKLVIIDPEVLTRIAETAAQLEAQEPVGYPERIAALRECIARLSPEQHELIIVRYGDDRSTSLETLADGKGRKLDALYKQLERLRGLLKRCVNAKLTTP